MRGTGGSSLGAASGAGGSGDVAGWTYGGNTVSGGTITGTCPPSGPGTTDGAGLRTVRRRSSRRCTALRARRAARHAMIMPSSDRMATAPAPAASAHAASRCRTNWAPTSMTAALTPREPDEIQRPSTRAPCHPLRVGAPFAPPYGHGRPARQGLTGWARPGTLALRPESVTLPDWGHGRIAEQTVAHRPSPAIRQRGTFGARPRGPPA